MPCHGTINSDHIASWFQREEADDATWDRVVIAQYRDRMAILEMSSSPDFAVATFPDDESVPDMTNDPDPAQAHHHYRGRLSRPYHHP